MLLAVRERKRWSWEGNFRNVSRNVSVKINAQRYMPWNTKEGKFPRKTFYYTEYSDGKQMPNVGNTIQFITKYSKRWMELTFIYIYIYIYIYLYIWESILPTKFGLRKGWYFLFSFEHQLQTRCKWQMLLNESWYQSTTIYIYAQSKLQIYIRLCKIYSH